MSMYWAILMLPVLFGLGPVRADPNLKKIVLWLSGLALVILIGLRHEIGGDWFRYLNTAYGINKGDNFDFLSFYTGDYGYRLIHWVSVNYLNGIYSTNLISSIFFVGGLIRFCRAMPIPWLALFISVPFLIVVVSMGYTRQAAAVGFLMWGLIDLINGKKANFYICLLLGALFHYTVLIMLPIGIIYHSNKGNFSRNLIIFLILILSSLSVYYLFISKIEHMIYYYITIKFHHSDGALVRVFMNSFSAIIFFIYRDRFKKAFHDEKLWFIVSVVSILMFPLALYYSTFTDRIAIYFLPLQIVVLSRIPILIASRYYRTLFIFGVLLLYIAALFVWLNFGNFSSFWLPYQNILTI